MRQRFRGWASRVSSLGCLIALGLAGGCAPMRFGPAIAYYAEKAGVTDAAARHTTTSPYYRFNTMLLSDLDDALAQSDVRTQRSMAAEVLRRANALSQTSSANEIARMSIESRRRLAALAGVEASTTALQEHFAVLANAALQQDLKHVGQYAALTGAALESDEQDVDRFASLQLERRLRAIRSGLEKLPDDRRRTERRVLYAWAGLLTADGIAREEAKLPEKCLAKAEKKVKRIAIWRPAAHTGSALVARYAPNIGVEWTKDRAYDANSDRIGAVKLSTDGGRIEVRIDPTEPTVYAYRTVAKIHGRRLRQLNYVWWFPERPEMTQDDPVAGHIDGSMLRITLDAHDEPIFVESSLNCGCGHEVFVSGRIESAAREAFGNPLAGKRFAVEKHVPGKHDVVVIDTFDTQAGSAHPLVLVAAGYHEVFRVRFDTPAWTNTLEIGEDASYQLANYDTLDALPVGDHIASMFGPDGLVHYAGRPEGFLLAPSGMLSGGQPRKRGTQRIRWDDYLHDDPYLLEKTLRMPPLD